MTTRSERAISFGAAAQNYDRYRVGAPPEILNRLLPTGCEAVLDLGAGTGAVTRHLVDWVPRVFAVDPDERMRELLSENCPSAVALDGTAERIPLPDASVDAVFVASAWHWVDTERAIPEIARVLGPGGTLVILWNRRDRTVPWVSDMEAFRRRITNADDLVEERIHYFLQQAWLPAGSPFADVEITDMPWKATLTRDELCGLLTTFTGYLMAPDKEKPELMRRYRAYVKGDARMGVDDVVDVPMLCHAWHARVKGGDLG
jgi:SAM-dependent methyltransferase